MKCDFVQVVAKDGVNLEGLVFGLEGCPSTHSARSGQTPTSVGVWIHGLTSNAFRNYGRATTLARVFNDNGLAFATFNTRGHDVVAYSVKSDRRRTRGYKNITIGSAYEKFEDSVLDLDAIAEYLGKKFKKVVLLGHSTGANKVAFYLSRPRVNKMVVGGALISPVSDAPGWRRQLGERYEEALALAKKMMKGQRGKELMPQELIGSINTARRFLGLATHEATEQLFPDREFRGLLRVFSKIKTPTFVLFGGKDDYLFKDRITASELINVFAFNYKGGKFRAQAIPGADHGFVEKEEELGKILIRWIMALD